MDNQEVKYTLILEGLDRLEKGMASAKSHSDGLDGVMGKLKGTVLGLIGAYAGFEALKASLHEFQEHKIAVATLTQMYENNRDSVKMTIEQLDELAEKTESLTGIESEHVMAAEQTLMKYKDLKVSYEDLIPLSADLARGMGTDITSAADMLGKALENPTRAARLLMQTGASPEQAKMYQQLSATGQAAKAQAYLIDVLGDKYKGLAQTAFENDSAAQLRIGFKQVRESIGELIENGLVLIMPYIQAAFGAIKGFVGWLKEHEQVVKGFGIAVGIVAAAFLAYKLVIFAIEAPLMIAAAAQWALNLAMTANPIGLIIAAIAALVVGIYEAYQHFEGFRRVVNTVWAALKAYGMALWDFAIAPLKTLYYAAMAVWDALTGDFEGAEANVKNIVGAWTAGLDDIKDGVKDVQTAWNADYSEQTTGTTSADKKVGESGKSVKAGKGLGDMTPTSQADKVSGTKQVVINVTIGKLVETVKVQAQNLKEGINQAAPDVAKALLGAVNQFSASTDI